MVSLKKLELVVYSGFDLFPIDFIERLEVIMTSILRK